MPDVTPAQELRAAAERLRELAAKATPGPWTTELRPLGGVDPSVEECWVTGPLGVNGRIEVARGYAHEADNENGPWLVQEDAAWIATLSPAIAEPLALWLDTHVQWAQDVQVVFFEPDAGEVVDIDAARWPGLAAALAFARAIPSPTGNPGGET